jgi:TPR repeat protein
MKTSFRLLFVTMAMLIAQTVAAQEKRNYRDIAFDYLMQNISSIEARPWSVKADHYDRMPNGDYLVKLTITRTLTRQEDRLVNNQVQAYGATFNVGVRNATVNINYEDTKSYLVFVDRFGEPTKYMDAPQNHVFKYWGGNAWLLMNKHKENIGNKQIECYNNIACFSNKGDMLWHGRDIKIYGWGYTGQTVYTTGTYHDNGLSVVRSIDVKTLQPNDKVISGGIPYGVDFEAEGLRITKYNSNGQSSNFIFPYAASDTQFQIEQVLKSYDLTRASDQVALGERYLNGNVVDKNEKKAVELFEKAANQNSDIGMLKLAECYKKGVGVIQDNAKAFSLYEKSANMGNSDAMIVLSDMYAEGNGVERNMSKALYWKEKLAFKGNLNAQKYVLANQSINYEKYDISADNAFVVARESHKDGNYDWAKFCYERAVSLGSKDALFDYAKWLYEGNGITRDCNKAVEYLTQLGEENNVKAQMLLRKIYKENKGIAPDVKKEMYWAIKAAENGDVDSQVSLGYAYQNGIGVKKNKKLAFAMYEKAAEQGNQEAIKELIYCYANGNGVKKEVAYSVVYFKKLDDANTQLEIAQAFEKGVEVKRDEAVAMMMYEHMVKNNNMTAGYKLVELYIRNGGYDEAITVLADISKMPGGSGTDNYSIGSYYTGMIWEKKGRIQQALDCYQNSSLPEAKQRYETLKAAWRRNNYR